MRRLWPTGAVEPSKSSGHKKIRILIRPLYKYRSLYLDICKHAVLLTHFNLYPSSYTILMMKCRRLNIWGMD
jgi:hypothetical protein